MPSKTHSTLQYQPQKEENNSVDMSNLYIKNLEPHVGNYELNQAFRKFGRIISARVMTNPATGQSKGYGFVSFSKSEEAAAALDSMNGIMLGNRPLFVAYHEPRKSRTPNTFYNNYPSFTDYSSTNGLGINNVDELGMNMNVKELSIGQKSAPMHTTTINLPTRKDVYQNRLSPPSFSSSPISGTSTGKSLASLASGLSIQPPPPATQQQHQINIGANGRPTLRRRGSLESVMTESSANIQRTKLEQAVRNSGTFGKQTDDIVDMLLTLKRKERSLCLFNPDFLQEKIQLALDALATCIDSDEEDDDEDEEEDGDLIMRNNNHTTKSSPPPPPPVYYQPPKRESKAIPIVAPKPDTQKEIESLLISLENKPTHEKKQLLGDKLFPLVKSTGTKHAPKVTIRLLDTVDLSELAHIMYDTPLLKTRVEEAFQSLQ